MSTTGSPRENRERRQDERPQPQDGDCLSVWVLALASRKHTIGGACFPSCSKANRAHVDTICVTSLRSLLGHALNGRAFKEPCPLKFPPNVCELLCDLSLLLREEPSTLDVPLNREPLENRLPSSPCVEAQHRLLPDTLIPFKIPHPKSKRVPLAIPRDPPRHGRPP